jgi:hypothetical protein
MKNRVLQAVGWPSEDEAGEGRARERGRRLGAVKTRPRRDW